MNKIFDEVAEYYYDHYRCDSIRLTVLFGKDAMMQMAKNIGLDKIYVEEWNKLMEDDKGEVK